MSTRKQKIALIAMSALVAETKNDVYGGISVTRTYGDGRTVSWLEGNGQVSDSVARTAALSDAADRLEASLKVANAQFGASLTDQSCSIRAEQSKAEAFLADAEATAMDGLPVSQFDVRPLEMRFYDWCVITIKAPFIWVYDGLALFGEFLSTAILVPIVDMLIDLFIWVEKGINAAWSRVKDFYRMHRG